MGGGDICWPSLSIAIEYCCSKLTAPPITIDDRTYHAQRPAPPSARNDRIWVSQTLHEAAVMLDAVQADEGLAATASGRVVGFGSFDLASHRPVFASMAGAHMYMYVVRPGLQPWTPALIPCVSPPKWWPGFASWGAQA
eukprot:SAG22_NODE_1844_length_3454_cov_2.054844_7_plen_138_part_01